MLVEMANQEEPIKSHSVFATGLAALGPASHFRSSAPADDMQRQVIASVVGKRARQIAHRRCISDCPTRRRPACYSGTRGPFNPDQASKAVTDDAGNWADTG